MNVDAIIFDKDGTLIDFDAFWVTVSVKAIEDVFLELGIEELFDKIYTDDGNVPIKPDPYCVFDFCKLTGIERERVVMVGDTMTDIRFAKNAGVAVIGVAKSAGTERSSRRMQML